MHIKAFLKKISQMPSTDPGQILRVSPTPNRPSLQKSRTSLGSFNDRMIAAGAKNPCQAISYLNNHHPALKARLGGQTEHSIRPELTVQAKFRQRIQQRLMDLMNQRKDLVVTHTKTKKQSSASMHYSSVKEKGILKSQKKMPDYVQNIMRPCKVTSISIGSRPKTSSIVGSRSEPKLYCKQILPTRQRHRMSTVALSTSHKQQIRAKSRDWEQKKIELMTEGKLDAWNRSKQKEEEQFQWLG